MSRTARAELLEALAQLSAAFPDWRFGQLVANIATAAKGPKTEAIWDCEDDELLAAAHRLLERNRERPAVTSPATTVANLAQPDAPART